MCPRVDPQSGEAEISKSMHGGMEQQSRQQREAWIPVLGCRGGSQDAAYTDSQECLKHPAREIVMAG